MTGPNALILSILMLATFLMAAGGIFIMLTGRDRRKAVLMFALAMVMFANVLIWVIPTS